MIAVESGTSALPDFPDFRLSLSFVTATTPLQDESSGAMVGPNRAKVRHARARAGPSAAGSAPPRRTASGWRRAQPAPAGGPPAR